MTREDPVIDDVATGQEEWRAVPGYEGLYEVSDLGRVRSLDRALPYVHASGKQCTRRLPGVTLRPAIDSAGYLSVCLKHHVSTRVHWLVLAAFTGPRPKGMQCLHNDGDRLNNVLPNLRYGTRSENMVDLFHHGHRKLSREQVLAIRAARDTGSFNSKMRHRLAAEFKVSLSTIQDVVKGRAYTYVT